MKTDAEITAIFWKHLRADRTVMLGLADDADATFRPMTAQVDGNSDQGPIWFFTSTDAAIAVGMTAGTAAVFTFTSKGFDVFATIHGTMTRSTDPATIDRLWNPWVAAWYEGGKTDPKLLLLRFDPARAEIWRNETGLLAGLKLLFSSDAQSDFTDNIAKVSLS